MIVLRLRSILCVLFIQVYHSSLGQDIISIHPTTNPIQRIKHLQICEMLHSQAQEQVCDSQTQTLINLFEIPDNQPVAIKTTVIFPKNYQEEILVIKTQGFRGVQQIYWDGKLIGQSGILSNDTTQGQIGRYAVYAYIPGYLAQAGLHKLSIQYQQFYPSKYSLASVFVGDYLAFQANDQYINHQMTLMFAIFLISGMFFLIFYFGFGRKTSFLFLSLYCITYAIKSILKPYQGFYTPDFIISYLSYENSHLAANLGSIFLIAFLLWEMVVPYKKRFLFLFVLLSIGSYWLITEVHFLMILMVCSLLIISYGFLQGRGGMWWIFIGLIGYAFFAYLWIQQILGYGYFAGIIFFIICMTVSVGQKVAREIQLRQAALLRSSTLENQLLKKSIQPHFILNSLASLQELIDQNPTGASDFVDQLAEEFKLLSRVSNQKLIPIQDELHMCQTHLKIMEYRKNSRFTLQTAGLSGEEMIPPGVFHTLIENGITHGYGTKHQGCFFLKKHSEDGHIVYTFFNDGEIESSTEESLSKGTGLRYIEARLRETYQDCWLLESKQVQGGWEVKISIKNSV